MSIKINKVYTKSGDLGETRLAGVKRVKKSHILIELIGTIDELNSFMGMAKTNLDPKTVILKSEIELLQQQLFDLGAEVASCYKSEDHKPPRIGEEQIRHLENLCDICNEDLPELKSFILPGGTNLSASLHIARTIARRAERVAVKARNSIKVNLDLKIVSYLNRLSDLLFIFARWTQIHQGGSETLWVEERCQVLNS